ncbi:MAG: hypothetical protein FWD52_03070 [Candidatus Bathyarchaeota archaeon]|nr:hypothetical protein [Candidatus Termiticorpusculum sp.]
MSSKDKSRMYGLIPSIYHQLDLQHQTFDGHRPLQDLVAVMEETLKILENDVEGLYENWFIETCDEWVTPYIGDLIDANLLRLVKGTGTISSKAYVANTVHYRKRKGTVAILEEIARDVTGWDAHVVEFFRFLSTTQNVNHSRLENKCTLNIVDPGVMELVGTAFDPVSHTVDVRSVKDGCGFYNVANVGLFLWRLTAYPVRAARAFWYGGGRYSFSSIGLDVSLFNHPVRGCDDVGVLSGEVDVSMPIRRSVDKAGLNMYYGEGKSIFLQFEKDGAIKSVAEEQIVFCDLSDVDEEGNWRVPVEFGLSDVLSEKVAVDPVLGRILFLDKSDVERKVFVSYYYGFSADMGGGFYRRDLYESELGEEGVEVEKYRISSGVKVANVAVGGFVGESIFSINKALEQWRARGRGGCVLFEIADSDIYRENISRIEVPEGVTLVLRSAQEQRATLTAEDDDEFYCIEVSGGGAGSCLVLDGLLFNHNVCLKIVEGSKLDKLVIQHCTFVPSSAVTKKAVEGVVVGESIIVERNDCLSVVLSKTICGKILMRDSKCQLILKDSIVDNSNSGGVVGLGEVGYAVQCFDALLENSTIFGKSCFDILRLASNVIFTDTVRVKRRQEGGVRFSYVPNRFEQGVSASKVPRCYRCQPENVNSSFTPHFSSEKYGTPGYAQLHSRGNVKELFDGADNGSEIGAFNQIYQSHRINNLLATFAEYLPFGLAVGVILVT